MQGQVLEFPLSLLHTHTHGQLQSHLSPSLRISHRFWPGAHLIALAGERSTGNLSIWLSTHTKHSTVCTHCIGKHRIITLGGKKNLPFHPEEKKKSHWPKNLVVFISPLNSWNLTRRSQRMIRVSQASSSVLLKHFSLGFTWVCGSLLDLVFAQMPNSICRHPVIFKWNPSLQEELEKNKTKTKKNPHLVWHPEH